MARAYCEGRVASSRFVETFASSADSDISELVELVKQEPDRTGYFTLSPVWLENRERILALIHQLEER